MKFFKLITIFFVFISFVTPTAILASDRNIFGLHLTQTSDIDKATPIINSSGGNWGWATIVIRFDQLNHQDWQDFFDKCRQNHIIPIVRIATLMENDYWKKPSPEEINILTSFLNSLNWPTEKQHVILFNEINHGQEWGGGVDIQNYVDLFIYTSQKLKSYNPNFVILGPALDLASPDSLPNYLSSQSTYQAIYDYNPKYFDNLDAIASHSYPNHGFIGTPNDTGQHSILGYQWELDFIKSLGINKNYPIFITETGWPHQEGEEKDRNYYTSKTTSDFLLRSLQIWEEDPQVQAVTPFIFNFPYHPFDHFSWINKEGMLYPEYQKIIEQPKKGSKPSQITKYESTQIHLPAIIFPNKEYKSTLTLKNTGQSIWGEGESSFCLQPQSTQNLTLSQICTSRQKVLPGQHADFTFSFTLIPDKKQLGKSFISWENTKEYEITPFSQASHIYRPKDGFLQKISNFIKWLNPFSS